MDKFSVTVVVNIEAEDDATAAYMVEDLIEYALQNSELYSQRVQALYVVETCQHD